MTSIFTSTANNIPLSVSATPPTPLQGTITASNTGYYKNTAPDGQYTVGDPDQINAIAYELGQINTAGGQDAAQGNLLTALKNVCLPLSGGTMTSTGIISGALLENSSVQGILPVKQQSGSFGGAVVFEDNSGVNGAVFKYVDTNGYNSLGLGSANTGATNFGAAIQVNLDVGSGTELAPNIVLYGNSEVNGNFNVYNGVSRVIRHTLPLHMVVDPGTSNYSTDSYSFGMGMQNYGSGSTYDWRLLWGPTNQAAGTWQTSPTMTLYSNGNFAVVGSVSANGTVLTSDEKLKSNIETVPDALETVSKLRGVSFIRKATNQKDFGIIAQEVQQVIPEIVHENPDDGILSVSYASLAGHFIEAIKVLKTEIDILRAEIASLKAGI